MKCNTFEEIKNEMDRLNSKGISDIKIRPLPHSESIFVDGKERHFDAEKAKLMEELNRCRPSSALKRNKPVDVPTEQWQKNVERQLDYFYNELHDADTSHTDTRMVSRIDELEKRVKELEDCMAHNVKLCKEVRDAWKKDEQTG